MYAKAEDGNYKFGKQQLIDYIKSEMERKHGSYADTDNGGRRLETYDQFAKEFARCRDPKKGRKISASFRLFKSVQEVSHVMMFMLKGDSTFHAYNT